MEFTLETYFNERNDCTNYIFTPNFSSFCYNIHEESPFFVLFVHGNYNISTQREAFLFYCFWKNFPTE